MATCMPPMKKSVVTVKELTMDQLAKKYSPIGAPLHIHFSYTVREHITEPRWAVTFVADIAYKRVLKPLVSSSSSLDTSLHLLKHTPSDSVELQAHELYKVELHLPAMDLSSIEEQYLLQIGLLRFELYSQGEIVDNVSLTVQVKKNDSGELMRMIMSPLV